MNRAERRREARGGAKPVDSRTGPNRVTRRTHNRLMPSSRHWRKAHALYCLKVQRYHAVIREIRKKTSGD